MSSRAPNVNFCIKLLSGKNVVLVEAPGYESEIFVPTIREGRISFTNIVPSRRCPTNVALQDISNTSIRSPAAPERRSCGVRPAACSTPNARFKTKAPVKENIRCGRVQLNSPHFAHMTPEPVRRAAVATSNGVIREAVEIYSSPAKKKCRPRTNVPTKPRCSSLFVPPSSPSPCARISGGTVKNHVSNVDTSPLRLPPTPRLNTPRNPRLQKLNVSNRPDVGKSPTNWRKCITPIRTYSRNPTSVPKSSSNTPVRKKCTTNIGPSFLANPTKGPKLNAKLETKQRNFIRDRKCIISPRSFKKQLKSNYGPKVDLRKQLPRSKVEYAFAKPAAFDMLSTPTYPCMSGKLRDMFRKKCINKASSTFPKYKVLANLTSEDTIDRALKARRKLQHQRAATQCNPPFPRVRTIGSHAARH